MVLTMLHGRCLQGMQMGIALPSILLNIQGAAGGAVLLGLVGFGILAPLLAAVIYLSRSSKYTGNNVMHQTVLTYYHFMKPSLAPRCVTTLTHGLDNCSCTDMSDLLRDVSIAEVYW